MTATRSIDLPRLSLRDALDLALLVEEEAKERYEELASQMEIHHNADAARFFRFMVSVEATHEHQLRTKRTARFGGEPQTVTRAMIFDVEAPDYDEVRAGMTVRQALETALRAERKAWEFFDAALVQVTDADVRELLTELREDEVQHRYLVEKQIAKLAPDGPGSPDDYGDEPVAQ